MADRTDTIARSYLVTDDGDVPLAEAVMSGLISLGELLRIRNEHYYFSSRPHSAVRGVPAASYSDAMTKWRAA